MNIVDYAIIGVLLLAAFAGSRRGVITSSVSLIGTLIVIVVAFYLKNPISAVMYQHLPFFNLGGRFEGVTVFNIVIYEAIAYVVAMIFLAVVLRVIMKVTGLFDKLINMTIILGLPNKILGAIVGFIQGYLLVFILVFVVSATGFLSQQAQESDYAIFILERTPVLSNIVGDTYSSISEIWRIVIEHEGSENMDEANLRSLEVLLRYNVITPASATRLIENGRIDTEGAAEVVARFRGN